MKGHSFKAFIQDDCRKDPVFACPVRTLWDAYGSYCKRWGFDKLEAHDFITYLLSEECIEIREGGKGRLRRVASGICVTYCELEQVG